MPEDPDTPETTTATPGKGTVRLGFALMTVLVLACLVVATVAAHEYVRLLEWAWAIS